MPELLSPRPRSAALDLFKTVLVVGMIAAHVIQLLSSGLPPAAERFSDTVNLITFSGFLFAFGLGIGLSRAERPRPILARLRPVAMLLAACWVSSLAFVVLVDHQIVNARLLTDLLSLRRLFGWSEFLASFAMLYLLIAFLRPAFIAIAMSPPLLALACALCLLGTLLVVPFDFPAIATLIGTRNFASFPLLPYLPWFLVGIAIGRQGGRLRPWQAFAALLLTVGFYAIGIHTGHLPERFPPAALWIVGPAAILAVELEATRWIAQRWPVPGWITLPGRHVLSFLLVSNLTIFTGRNWFYKPLHAGWQVPLVTAALLVAIGAVWLALEARQAKASPKGPAPGSSR